MIISIPEDKKITKKIVTLNESLFDDDDDLLDILNKDDDSYTTNNILKQYEEDEICPKVIRILTLLNVKNYELKCTGHGVLVDVHDNLYLPNKGLNKLGTSLFKFDIVEGSCNYTGNNLINWSFFPNTIKGNCYANFNNITSFDGAPIILGKLVATKLNKKPQYPLTDINYKKFKGLSYYENAVYIISKDKFGSILSINEATGKCMIKCNDDTKEYVNLDDVEYLGKLENLL